jgi:hypothetical protein
MGMLGMSQNIESPVQQHPVNIANDVQWISGDLKSLGDPHYFINQDDLDVFTVLDAHLNPWTFTNLPNGRASQTIVVKENVQFLTFSSSIAMESFRKPLRTSRIILHLPLAVIRGEAPFLSEASLENFLDFWKGIFFPMCDASIHYLTDCSVRLPSQVDVLYINRRFVLDYFSG